MHPPTGAAWLVWLETSSLAGAMRQWQWLYPIVEIVHILGFVVLVGAAFFFDLRLLGLGRTPVTGLAQHLLTRARVSFVIILASGLMMFTAHATEMAANPAFRLKLILIAAALVNAAAFHHWPFRSAARWDTGGTIPAPAKLAAMWSLVLLPARSPAAASSPIFSRRGLDGPLRASPKKQVAPAKPALEQGKPRNGGSRWPLSSRLPRAAGGRPRHL